ncbi:serine/threonine protein kinase [Nonomuraea zeae]|uniref:non-specific serine/threonine protein kinase n=2 Tax=Nonomuraea zeae TaxID=1642303 RepID=A0A5S4GNX2_9ACTN|nr:serine/threonine protein kinase [Nonomuraea zeae]
MGTVWRAMDELLRQEVAIKEVRLPPDLDEASRAEMTDRTLREARAAAALRSHPSIVTVHDVVLDDGRPWIVMELVRGRSLDRVLRDEGPLPARRVAEIGLRMLDALSAAHASGVMHRDVKPANVMLAEDGRVLLTDFGIATIAGDTALTQTGFLTGSPGYIAPERLRGESDGPPADLWSLGATLFAAVEGGPPFARQNEAAVLAAVLMQEPAPFRLAGPLAPVLTAMLEKDPAARCSSQEAAGWLAEISRGSHVTVPSARYKRPPAPRRRRRRVVLGGALAVVLTAAAGVAVTVQMFPKLAFVIVGAFAPKPTYHVPSPASRTPEPEPEPLIGDGFEACDLLTGTQVRALLGGTPRRQWLTDTACMWYGQDGTSLSLLTMRSPNVSGASFGYKFQVDSMKDEPKRSAGTKLRKGPDRGDEAYSYTKPRPGWPRTNYNTKVLFRMSNVVVTIDITIKRSGFTTADRAAELVETALGKHRE